MTELILFKCFFHFLMRAFFEKYLSCCLWIGMLLAFIFANKKSL